jgi:hypothetical protein
MKRYPFILLIIIIISSSTVYSQERLASTSDLLESPVFTETFDNNTNNWIVENNWIGGQFLDGYYTIECKNYQGSTGLSYKSVALDFTKDFVIETSIKVIKGTGGLVFGQTENFDHYRFELGKKNKVMLLKDTPSENKAVQILESFNAESIKNNESFNRLKIVKIKNTFQFLLNDNLIAKLNTISLQGDQLGFNVGLKSEIVVDYLKVSYLAEKKTEILAAKEPESPVQGPKINWLSPRGENTSIEAFSARVKTEVTSEKGIKDIYFYVNGVASRGEPQIKQIDAVAGVFQVEKVIEFIPGENSIYILATNIDGSTKSELRYFTIPSATTPTLNWKKPLDGAVAVNVDNIDIEVGIQSLSNLKSVKVFVNGVQQPEQNVIHSSASGNSDYAWKSPVILKQGENDIYVIATNIAGSTTSEKRIIDYSPELKEKRLALVLGNAEYGSKTSLKNPVNDANLMEATLKDLGFDVIKRTNSEKVEMEQAIMEFNAKLPDYNVALFYYAGHGVQVDGVNYLLPTDAKLEDKANCQWEAISMTDVVRQFEKYPDNINIVILDACRNNPFKSWVRGNESGFKFLPNVSGTIIGYATAEGATAADGSSANGVYTEEIVKQMLIPQAVESVFKRARVQVEERTNGMQSPQETTGLRGDFYFVK